MMMKYALMLPFLLALASCSNTSETNVVDSVKNLADVDSLDYSDSVAPKEWPQIGRAHV